MGVMIVVVVVLVVVVLDGFLSGLATFVFFAGLVWDLDKWLICCF